MKPLIGQSATSATLGIMRKPNVVCVFEVGALLIWSWIVIELQLSLAKCQRHGAV